MEGLISIIVPVYNSERYLKDCIKSIQAQTYRHFEVLLVDDGSVDNSRRVCEEACRADGRFRLLAQPHRGVSFARNEGMRAAGGEYLFFLDSDDAIHPDLLEVLHRLMRERQAVMAGAGYFRTDADRAESAGRKRGDSIHYTFLRNEEALECFPFEMRDYFFFSIGGKMILREAAEAVRFSEKLSNSEDTLFLYRILAGGADAVVLHEKWYYYRKHGAGTSAACSVESYQSRYRVCRYIYGQEKRAGRIANAVNWEDFIIRFLLSWRLMHYRADYRTGQRELNGYFARILREQRRTELFSRVRFSTRARYWIARLCFPLYRRFFLLALFFVERRDEEVGLLPRKYMERQTEEAYRLPRTERK